MKKFMRILATVVVAVSMVVSTVGCGKTSSSTSGSSALDKIKQKGVLTLATASGYPPYEFVSVDNNGQVIGIDVALAQAVADKLGVKLQVQDMAFSELITTLQAGNCDLVIAGLPATEERAQAVDFSNVYLNDKQCLIVRKDQASKYSALSNFAGKNVAVEMGSSSETVAKSELTGANITSLSLISDVFLELENGKADAVATGEVVGKQYVLSNSDLTELTNVKFANQDKPASAAVQKGNKELLDLVNEVIKDNQDNGNFSKWVDQYSLQASKEANK